MESLTEGEKHAADVVRDALARVLVRALQDAMLTATATYWHRRADEFEAARRRPGELVPETVDPVAAAARDRRLAETAHACREHARLIELDPEPLTVETAEIVRTLMGVS